jgi:pyruvate/2-oxoglutarate dehydrogenase complex dihydrolipoamide dehydrogenase (E3) component
MPTARVDYYLPQWCSAIPIGLTEEETLRSTTAPLSIFIMGESGDKLLSKHKLICVGPVGLHAIGIGSDEMLQGFRVAMKMRVTKGDCHLASFGSLRKNRNRARMSEHLLLLLTN